MSKKRHEPPPKNEPSPERPPVSAKTSAKKSRVAGQGRGAALPWHPALRWLVSLLVVLHLLAVFVAPWDLSTGRALPPGYLVSHNQQFPLPESPAWQKPLVTRALRSFFEPYLDLTYLNNGYQFFAPDPPPGSHIIRWKVWDTAGAEIAQGQFPDLKEQWPRLFYHRHMMLAAQTGDMGEESGRGYARHLLRKHDGQTIRLEWVIHKLLSPSRVLEGTPLDLDSTYILLAEINETAAQPTASSGSIDDGELPPAIPRETR